MKIKKKRAVPWWRQVWAHHSVRWILVGVLVLLILQQTARWWNPTVFPPVKQANIGVSFSTKQANLFDLDPQETFRALLDDMGIRHFRLMSYWDVNEPIQGKRDFSSLDWQIAEAKKRGADVTLAIGLRQPRWPECHEPDWATNLDIIEWRRSLNDYISTVVKRYENEPAVISWQLENEYFNGLFAKCRDASVDRLHTEFDLVKSISKKPIWMSMSDQGGYPMNMPKADRYGFSVYRTVWSTGLYTGYMTFPVPLWYHNLRKNIIQQSTDKDTFIHELQLEPWGPTDIPYLTTEQQNQSMSTKQIHESLLYARELGMKDMYTWGGEWWYWRKIHGDPSIWSTVKEEFREASAK